MPQSLTNTTKKRKRSYKPKRLKFEEMPFSKKCEFFELMNWLATHPLEAEVIMSIISKESPIAQRIIEYTQTGYAKKYNLRLEENRLDVSKSFKFGPRKDPNCRGPRLPPYPYKNAIYCSTARQLHSLIFTVARKKDSNNSASCRPETVESQKFKSLLIEYVNQEEKVYLDPLQNVDQDDHKETPMIKRKKLMENYQNLGPVFRYIVEHYEVIKNDLNSIRELLPQKKDVSGIQRPEKLPPRPSAYWIKKPL